MLLIINIKNNIINNNNIKNKNLKDNINNINNDKKILILKDNYNLYKLMIIIVIIVGEKIF